MEREGFNKDGTNELIERVQITGEKGVYLEVICAGFCFSSDSRRSKTGIKTNLLKSNRYHRNS